MADPKIKDDGGLLDPKNDYVFKRLFVRRPELLVPLINAVRVGEPPIREVDIRNPEIDGADKGLKGIRLDILARDEAFRVVNVEMQTSGFDPWPLRSVYYGARIIGEQLQAGESYAELRPVVAIHLLDFELFTADEAQCNQAVWRFELRDQALPQVRLSDHLTLHMIELPKADRLGLLTPELAPELAPDLAPELASELAPLAAWITFFRHWREVKHMSAHDYAPVNEALEELKKISADEQERYRALSREMALRDEVSLRNAERRKGEATILFRQLNRRFGPLDDTIAQRLGKAKVEQLEHWADRLLDAPTLSAVFDDH